MTVTPCSASSRYSASSTGISWRQGTHQLAQKFSTTTLPRSAPRSIGSPEKDRAKSAGAFCPARGVPPPSAGDPSSAPASTASATPATRCWQDPRVLETIAGIELPHLVREQLIAPRVGIQRHRDVYIQFEFSDRQLSPGRDQDSRIAGVVGQGVGTAVRPPIHRAQLTDG